MKVKYKNKVWDVLCPKDLKFPPGTIRNILIERGSQRIITNFNQVTTMKTHFNMEEWL